MPSSPKTRSGRRQPDSAPDGGAKHRRGDAEVPGGSTDTGAAEPAPSRKERRAAAKAGKASRKERRAAKKGTVPEPRAEAELAEAAEAVQAVHAAEASGVAEIAEVAEIVETVESFGAVPLELPDADVDADAAEDADAAADADQPEPEPSRRSRRAARKANERRLRELSAAGLPQQRRKHVRNRRAARARRRVARRSALLAAVIVIAILSVTVSVTGAVVAANQHDPARALAYPLQIYPVSSTTAGECQPGTQGVTGPGPTCYQVTEGLAIHRADAIDVRHDPSYGFEVFIRLDTGDRTSFADLTRSTVGRSLIFVVRERLVTVSQVDTPILGGQILITGLSDVADADRVVRNLRGDA